MASKGRGQLAMVSAGDGRDLAIVGSAGYRFDGARLAYLGWRSGTRAQVCRQIGMLQRSAS